MQDEITFVTSVMDRYDHIKKTLPCNLINNKLAKFVILDAGPTQEVENWIFKYFWSYLMTGKIVHIRINSDLFYTAWFRNISILLTNTKYFCNVDADNYTDTDFDVYLLNYFKKHPNSVFVAKRSAMKDCFGRIAMAKEDFIRLRGYNECFGSEYGFEDLDLIQRAVKFGLSKVVISPNFLNAIPHSDELRSVNMLQNDIVVTNQNHMQQSKLGGIINPNGFGISSVQVNCVSNISTGHYD